MRDESDDNFPIARSTIRRDRGLVRLRTNRIRSRSKSPQPKEVAAPPEVPAPLQKFRAPPEVPAPPKEVPAPPEVEEKSVDIDPGYISSERSSGSWRKKFEGELDLYDRKVSSPTAKTPGESFFEKYHIKDNENDSNMHYLTIDDLPAERRESVRRRSGGRLPSFKEICSDISSDKLTDDLNAGELRRRASLIIEEEISFIKQSESGTMMCTLEQQVSDPPLDETDGDQRKSRKVKKVRQKITAKTSFENPEPAIIAVIAKVEIEETAFDVPHVSVIEELTDDVDNRTFKVPLRKKKKLTVAVETKITCDPSKSTAVPAVTSKVSAASAEIKTNETADAAVNIKTKNCDLDSKLLLDKDAAEAPGVVKKAVKSKPLAKVEVPKMNPLRKDLSADDFWGMIGSRETTNFCKRKQQVIDDHRKTIVENSWMEDEETPDAPSAPEGKSAAKTSAIETPTKNASRDLQASVQTPPVVDDARNKSTSSDTNLNSKKPEKEFQPAVTAPAKAVEPKVEQKREENVTKINKSDATKADKVSEGNASENRKINESAAMKQVEGKEEEKPLKLQPVPKPSKLNLASKNEKSEVEAQKNLQMKTEEKLPDSPKTPPWKVAEKLPESPKTPPWKLSKAKSDEKLPESPKTPPYKLSKVEEKLPESPKTPPWKLSKTKSEEKLPESPTWKAVKDLKAEAKFEPKVENKTSLGKTQFKVETMTTPALSKMTKVELKVASKAVKTEIKSDSPEPVKKTEDKIVEKIATKAVLIDDKKSVAINSKISPKVVKVDDKKSTAIDEKLASKAEIKLEPPEPAVKKAEDKIAEKILTKIVSIDDKKSVTIDDKLASTAVASDGKITPKAVKVDDKKTVTVDEKIPPKTIATIDKITTKTVDEKIATKIIPPSDKTTAKTSLDKITPKTIPTVDKLTPKPLKTEPLKEPTSKKLDDKPATVKVELMKENSPKPESKLTKPKIEAKIASPNKTEEPSTKKESLKLKDKIPDTKLPSSITAAKKEPAVKKKEETVVDQKLSVDHKSQAEVKRVEQPSKCDVNDQSNKKAAASGEGQKLATEEAAAKPTLINETKNTQPIDASKSFGTLSKFKTLNNLNSIASVDDQQSADQSNNKTIATSAQIEAQPISVATESTKAGGKEESESESEESSYEDDSEESSDDMEKKNFDPQKKVKLDFAQMRKCYGGGDEKSTITLVARPRPLWKIKRNRHAVFSESSESDSSGGDDARDSATGSSQSSTQSEKKKKKDGGRGDDDNITSLMPSLSVQDENDGDDSESKKKNRLSTSSHDSGFCGLGATAAKSPRRALGEFAQRFPVLF